MSNAMISFIHAFMTGFLMAAKRTNAENKIKNVPTSINGATPVGLNILIHILGVATSKTPVIPELMAFNSNTFFSVISFEFCFCKDISDPPTTRYLYAPTYWF